MTAPAAIARCTSGNLAIWVYADGADSTGTFAGATGHGTDIAYPAGDTAAPTGTITLAK